MNSESRQFLDVLAIFYYFAGGLAILFGFFPLVHLMMGLGMMTGSLMPGSAPEDSLMGFAMGGIFILIALAFILCLWGYGASMIVAGHGLKRQQRYIFCVVMAAVSCAFFPVGTALGIFTILVLVREDVKIAFGQPVPSKDPMPTAEP